MKLPHLKMSKPLLVTAAVAGGVLVGGFTVSQSEAALDWLGFEQKLQQHEEQLDNHEARITNTEEDVTDLQENTNTAPSENRVSVPTVTTTPTEPAPEQAPAPQVTVSGVSQQPTNQNGKTMCSWTYSDGTASNFFLEDEPNRLCDATVIGTVKAS